MCVVGRLEECSPDITYCFELNFSCEHYLLGEMLPTFRLLLRVLEITLGKEQKKIMPN